MNSVRKSIFRLGVIAALLAACPAFAGNTGSGTVGGTVGAINSLVDNYHNDIVIVPSVGQTQTEIAYGTIDNNSINGWRLRVQSTNSGKLVRTGSTAGAGRQIVYTNITFVKTGGTLGAGLNNPEATRNIADGGLGGGGIAGSTFFFTGTAFDQCNTATSATVNYGYSLRITWGADESLLAGDYVDTLTLTLSDGI